MTSDHHHGLWRESDLEAAQKAYVAQLLKGFDLAIADGTSLALHAAQEAFTRAVLMDDSRPEAYLGLAYCHMNLGDPDRALCYFDLCSARGFGSEPYESLLYEHDDEDGLSHSYEVGLDTVQGWRATCHLERGAIDAAKHEMGRLSHDPPQELRAGLAVLHGRICLAEGNLEGAQRRLGEALAWDSNDPDAHCLRGQLHEHRGDAQAALQAYARAIRIAPDDPDFRIAHAELLITKSKVKQAIEDLTIALRLLEEMSPHAPKLERIARLRAELATKLPRTGK